MQTCRWRCRALRACLNHSHLGLKQSCPLSPLLFGVYVIDSEQVVEENSSTLCLPVIAGHPIPPSLFADDLAQIARALRGLQAQLDLLAGYSDE